MNEETHNELKATVRAALSSGFGCKPPTTKPIREAMDAKDAALLEVARFLDMDLSLVEVAFRMDPESEGGNCFALMPGEASSVVNPNECSCYQAMGGHSGADYAGCIQSSRPASPEEYADLKTQMERMGYVIKVIERGSRRLHDQRGEQWESFGSNQ
jgi:hypothetical protein